jgi:hypothetical protein
MTTHKRSIIVSERSTEKRIRTVYENGWIDYEKHVFTDQVVKKHFPDMVRGFHATQLSYEMMHDIGLPYTVLQAFRTQQYDYCLMKDKITVDSLKINDPIAIDGVFMDNDGNTRFAQVKYHSRPIQISDLGMFLVEASRRAARGLSPPILISNAGVTAQTAAVSREQQMRFDYVTIPQHKQFTSQDISIMSSKTTDYDDSMNLRQCQIDCLQRYTESDKSKPFVNALPPGAGKTLLAAIMIEQSGKLINVLASPVLALAQQNLERIDFYLTQKNIKHQSFMFNSNGSTDTDAILDVISAVADETQFFISTTYDSSEKLSDCLQSFPSEMIQVYFDEAHHLNNTTDDLFELTCNPVLMSGTWAGIRSLYIENLPDTNKCVLTIKDAIKAKYLSEYDVFIPHGLTPQQIESATAEQKMEFLMTTLVRYGKIRTIVYAGECRINV